MNMAGARGGERQAVYRVNGQVRMIEVVIGVWIGHDIDREAVCVRRRNEIGTRSCSRPIVCGSNQDE